MSLKRLFITNNKQALIFSIPLQALAFIYDFNPYL